MTENITGIVFVDTVRHVSCPQCKSDKGKNCSEPSGRTRGRPHGQRVKKFFDSGKAKPRGQS